MVSTKFIKQIKKLELDMMQMSQACLQGLSLCKHALFEQDQTLLDEVNELHEEVRVYGRELEQFCMQILLLQHPVAKDLRRITSSTNTIRDLIRIMDHEKEISELILELEGVYDDANIHDLFDKCKEMVSLAIQAFVQKDETNASNVIGMDDVVDQAYSNLKQFYIEKLSNRKESAEIWVNLLLIGKYLERICDHCVNIAKWILYEKNGVCDEK